MSRRDLGGGAFETAAGYSRAARAGSRIAVSATAALDSSGRALYPGDAERQARVAFERALAAAGQLGARNEDVVRTRIYLAPGADWRGVIEAHRELFADTAPANTTLYVAGFIPEGVLVEVELDAELER